MRRFGTVMRSGRPLQSTTRFWDFHPAANDRNLQVKEMENQSKT
jgi:hypothetical protein